MKAVPKIGLDGLYIENVIVDDAFSGVVPFYSAEPDLAAASIPPRHLQIPHSTNKSRLQHIYLKTQ